jgi:hypothetical protein
MIQQPTPIPLGESLCGFEPEHQAVVGVTDYHSKA